MKGFLKISAAASVLALCLLCAGCGEAYGTMKMADAQKEIEAGTDYLIVDVRTAEEYEKGHIPGALLVPVEDIRGGEPEALADKEEKIMVYCRTGRRSEEAAALLAGYGYTNVCDIGGFVDWTGEVETGGA